MKYYLNIFILLLIIAILTGCSVENLLVRATMNGNTKKVEKLVEKGAKVDYNAIFDETPLFFAATNGNFELVKYLISKGANLNYQKQGFILKSSQKVGGQYKYYIEKIPNGGRTILTSALLGWGDFDKIVVYLLEQGAKVNYKYIQYNAEPIIRMGNGTEIGGEGIGTYIPEKEKIETPLTLSINAYKIQADKNNIILMQKYKSTIQILLKYGADKNIVNGDGENAYQLANKYNLKEVSDILK